MPENGMKGLSNTQLEECLSSLLLFQLMLAHLHLQRIEPTEISTTRKIGIDGNDIGHDHQTGASRSDSVAETVQGHLHRRTRIATIVLATMTVDTATKIANVIEVVAEAIVATRETGILIDGEPGLGREMEMRCPEIEVEMAIETTDVETKTKIAMNTRI